MRNRRRAGAGLLVLLLLLFLLRSGRPAPQTLIAQTGPAVTVPIRVSGPSPFRPSCIGSEPKSKNYPNSAVEPSLAVDPRDPSHLAGVWQQDRWSGGAASGQRTAISHDGGKTWTLTSAPLSRCQGGNAQNGGDYERASDPWISFAPNGDLYQLALVLDSAPLSGMLVSKSTDGGASWSDPVTLIRDDGDSGFNDKGTITADPTDARYVYAVWDRLSGGGDEAGGDEDQRPEDSVEQQISNTNASGPAMFSRTSNGGRTWEPARAIYDPGLNAQTIGNQILVLPTGELVNLFVMIRTELSPAGMARRSFRLTTIRSLDKGDTWSDPVTAAAIQGTGVREPYTGDNVRTGDGLIVSFAGDPRSGAIYAVWEDRRFSDPPHADVAMTVSTDGGRTWSEPLRVNQTPINVSAFVPTITILADGSVGVAYYDFRNDSPVSPAFGTDYWLAYCRSACTDGGNWAETHIAGPFDLRTAPFARGLFLGDYEGIASAGNSVLLLFAQAGASLEANPSDAYFVSVTLPPR